MSKFVRKIKWLVLAVLVTSNCPVANGQLLTAFNRSREQNPPTGKKEQVKSLVSILEQVKEQYKINFHYDSELLAPIETDASVLSANNKNLDLALEELLKPLNLTIIKAKSDSYIIVPIVGPVIINKPMSTDNMAEIRVSGKVVDESGAALPGATINVSGTTIGTVTDIGGNYAINVEEGAVLVYSYVGFVTARVPVNKQTQINITLKPDMASLKEVVVVGYGVQKRSDITGSVASIPQERLELAPNVNIAQAIQGSTPGILVQSSAFGAAPNQEMMIRGRNSIKANNGPLVVLDGIPYGGQISDINPNDVKSIEILKDASAAAIYGSRGSNGVILVTTKEGSENKTLVSYDVKIGTQTFDKLPDLMNGPEFYEFKKQRNALQITAHEQAMYDRGEWTRWYDLALQRGFSQEHNLSVSGGFNKTKYYIAGSYLDVKGIAINDNFERLTTRVNIETKVNDWLAIGTRSQLSMDDRSGVSVDFDVWGGGLWTANPLMTPYDENGKLTLYPNPHWARPNVLQGLLFDDLDKSNQILSNNYAIVNFPFVKGLSYRLNTGLRLQNIKQATYAGVNTERGNRNKGYGRTSRANTQNYVIENILSYNRDFGKHNIFATALYSYEKDESSRDGITAESFPNDVLSWYAIPQAALRNPEYTFNETNLLSQMLRLNYGYDSRYLATFTVRRDGFSGFGSQNKWGVFPSIALAWNVANENFFPLKNIFDVLKVRGSYGLNGNQAVGAYETISRLTPENMVAGSTSLPGYKPSVLGQDALGWESSRALNFGLDFGFLEGRIEGDINWFKTNTFDLLLDRTISPVHGLTRITQNIGETQNKGIELSLTTRNISTSNFKWTTSGNFSQVKNEIVSLYGLLDANGKEKDDIANSWFIGQPIRANYNYVWDGVWQLEEAEEAKKWGSKPGFVKLKDTNGDGVLGPDDRQIIGQRDPKVLWGLSNNFSYRNFSLSIFMHGVHGVTLWNELMQDNVASAIWANTIKKDWWTPENPTNNYYMNDINAHRMAGVSSRIFEDAGFVRLKDVSLSYDFNKKLIGKAGLSRLRIFTTGRNLHTFTQWRGLDPEIANQNSYPLQKEYVFGINVGF